MYCDSIHQYFQDVLDGLTNQFPCTYISGAYGTNILLTVQLMHVALVWKKEVRVKNGNKIFSGIFIN